MLDHDDIRGLLPQRYPMLLLDSIQALEPGISAVGTKCVTGNEACYAHLPDHVEKAAWAYPNSLIVESFGQAGAVLWMQSAALIGSNPDGVLVFTIARDCFFEDDVFPGDVLIHRVNFDRVIANSAIFNGEVWVAERRIARIEWLMATIRPTQHFSR